MEAFKVAQRLAVVERTTNETSIKVRLCLDGSGEAVVDTGIGFFDHMLTALARHSLSDMELACKGDLNVDGHHTVEDVGICLGQALAQAAGDKKGITRYGHAIVPLDEAVIQCALDFSGRPFFGYHDFNLPAGSVGTFDASLFPEFFRALAVHAGLTLHLWQLNGENPHHIIEAAFKAVARSLQVAWQYNPRVQGVPSTKGVL